MESTESAFARNVATLRKQRDFTVRSLAERLEALGRPMHPSGVTKMENGARHPGPADLVALALALGVIPSRLLLPVDDPAASVALTPTVTVGQADAWAWALAQRALPGGNDEDFEMHAVPAYLRRTADHTASRAALDVLQRVQALLQTRAATSAAPEYLGQYVAEMGGPAAVRRALRRLIAEVDDLIGADDAD